jgi:hypothetical protein
MAPVRSVLSDEKKLSIAALSHMLPARLIEQTKALSATHQRIGSELCGHRHSSTSAPRAAGTVDNLSHIEPARLAHPVHGPDPPVLRNEAQLHVGSFAK